MRNTEKMLFDEQSELTPNGAGEDEFRVLKIGHRLIPGGLAVDGMDRTTRCSVNPAKG
jgi:hypothetical protein